MKLTYLKLDTRNRVALTKITKNLSPIYKAYMEGNKIILEPIYEVSEHEKWVYDPANKELVEEIKRRLKEGKKGIDLGSFAQYTDEE